MEEQYSDYESDLELDTIINISNHNRFDENNNNKNSNNKRKHFKSVDSQPSKRIAYQQQQLPRRPSSAQSTTSTKTSISSLSSTKSTISSQRCSESPSLGRSRRYRREGTPISINLRSQCSGDCCMKGLTGTSRSSQQHPHSPHRRMRTRSESKTRNIEINNKNFTKDSKKSSSHNLSLVTEAAIETSLLFSSSTASTTTQNSSVKQVEDYNHNICVNSNNNNNKGSIHKEDILSKQKVTDQHLSKVKSNWSSFIHQRYLDYLNYSQEERDLSKTDYTYAHSFSYSPLISRKDRFSWTVPNMSRASINHLNRSTILDKENVQRRLVENIPVSEITNSYNTRRTSPKNVRSTTGLMKDNVMHSTPKVKNAKAKIEYSDDDDDQVEEEINNGIQRNLSSVNYYKTNYSRKNANNKVKNNFNDAELSEDEEEITLIRRINRTVTKTVRNFFTGNSNSAQSTTTRQMSTNRNNLNNVVDDEDNHHNHNNSHLSSTSTIYQTRPNQNNGGNRYNTYGRPPLNTNNNNRNNNRKKMPNLFLILFLLTTLSSSCLYYYLYANNLKFANLLEDYSQSSSSFKFLNYKRLFGSGGGGDDDNGPLLTGSNSVQDISKINNEIQLLRNEVFLIKKKYDDSLEKIKTTVGDDTSSNNINNNNVGSSDPNMPNFDQVLERLATLEANLVSCCRTVTVNQTIEEEIKHIIDSKLKEQRDKHLQNEVDKIKEYLIMFVQDQTKNLTSAIGANASSTANAKNDNKATNSTIDADYIEQMIKSAIAKYDADKTGEADFALESSGAWIVSTRCSETFELYSASYKLLGLTLWRSSNTPRTLIQSGVIPGECWCFKSGEGRVAIHLSTRIIPTAFTYEHIPKQLSRDGNINSAPAKFAVYGLKSEDDTEPELLGEYHYLLNGEAMQRFEVQNVQTALHTFRNIELVVKSNHGHPEYTCLYRFRVHGTPVFD